MPTGFFQQATILLIIQGSDRQNAVFHLQIAIFAVIIFISITKEKPNHFISISWELTF